MCTSFDQVRWFSMMAGEWPGWLSSHFHRHCMELLCTYRHSISYPSSIQHPKVLVLGYYSYILNHSVSVCPVGLHYRRGTLSLRYSLLFIVRGRSPALCLGGILLHLSWLLITSLTLRNDHSKEWLESCILISPAKNMREHLGSLEVASSNKYIFPHL